ncbi:MAG: hypothetical protein KTR22_08020 [Flavobacteriaceae bacterium]|nr:hypothetical protein [Flavobacteriaceae bacterium]
MKKNLFITASSLTETIVAITIITICSLIGVIAYSAVLNSSPSPKEMDYEYAVEKLVSQAIRESNIQEGTEKFDGFTIHKKSIKEGDKGLYRVTFSVVGSRNHFQKEVMIYKRVE